MNSVDLARVGACVLKHAVTGEVRSDGCRAVGVPPIPAREPRQRHLGLPLGRRG